jgi:uncharacterized protein GlcG (DUF336 family)
LPRPCLSELAKSGFYNSFILKGKKLFPKSGSNYPNSILLKSGGMTFFSEIVLMTKKICYSLFLLAATSSANAACPNITYQQLTNALKEVVKSTTAFGVPTGGNSANTNGGLDFDMWATVVGNDGSVCLVTKSGTGSNDQWLLSRVISAQKANTALGLSTTSFALSTANLYSPVQPGGTLYGLQVANPTDTSTAYSGNAVNFGTPLDPMRGRKIGGTNVFGGGLALYTAGKLVGGLGVSGDTSCADHNIAWRLREKLVGFTSANVPNGVGVPKDNIIYLAAPQQVPPYNQTEQPHGFKHPWCSDTAKAISETF